ncbi:ATP-grasp domain-containing protein [Kribbella sp. NPDC051137]|uniref:ATP-grasp domain-containing protein n=1 Tax=Kribbella sp. NPDC051137 TaxID=3155045 RepID=UPI002F4FEA3E
MSARRFLVTGAGGPAGRSLVEQLVRRGVPVVAADMASVELPSVPVRRLPAATDPGFCDALLTLAAESAADVVVPTVTEELVVLAGTAERAGGPRVVVASAQAVRIANDKLMTCDALARAGVPVPRYAVPAGQREPHLGLPFLSKPRVGRGGRGVSLHYDPAAAVTTDSSLLLQEFVPGTEYAPNLYLAEDPADDVVVVLRKSELRDGLTGNAVAVDRVRAVDVAAVAQAAARAVGLRGPVDVDIRRRADGTPVVLEINARFGANSRYAPEVLDALLRQYEVPGSAVA